MKQVLRFEFQIHVQDFGNFELSPMIRKNDHLVLIYGPFTHTHVESLTARNSDIYTAIFLTTLFL